MCAWDVTGMCQKQPAGLKFFITHLYSLMYWSVTRSMYSATGSPDPDVPALSASLSSSSVGNARDMERDME